MGLLLPKKVGTFTDATIALTGGGTTYALTKNTGRGDAKGGTFTGTSIGDGMPVSGTYTCYGLP